MYSEIEFLKSECITFNYENEILCVKWIQKEYLRPSCEAFKYEIKKDLEQNQFTNLVKIFENIFSMLKNTNNIENFIKYIIAYELNIDCDTIEFYVGPIVKITKNNICFSSFSTISISINMKFDLKKILKNYYDYYI